MSSRHDRSVTLNPSPSPSDGVQHVCTICQAKESSHKHVFDTAKALSSHCRVKHAVRNDMRRYVALLSAAAYVKPLSVLGCLSFSICLIHVVRSVVMFSLPLLLPSVMSYVPSLTNLTRWRGEQHNKRGTLMQAFLCLLREWHCAKHDVR